MVQLNDGKWAHKPGQNPSANLGNINPSNYSWDLCDQYGNIVISNFYNSGTLYFAVKIT